MFNIKHNEITFVVQVVCHHEFLAFDECWRMHNTPIEGVTIPNPSQDSGVYPHAEPLDYTLAERIADLSGEVDPMAAAVRHAQAELARDAVACDYSLKVSAYVGESVPLFEDEMIGPSFSWSPEDDVELDAEALRSWQDHGLGAVALAHAQDGARAICQAADTIAAIAAEQE